MREKRRQNRRALRGLCCVLLMSGGLAACGDGDSPADEDTRVEECPAERTVRCADDSCVADAEACPGEDPDDPDGPDEPDEPEGEIAGEIVGMSPTTILAHAPEPVRLMLSVDDTERVQKLVDEGASWRVRLEKGAADGELIEAMAKGAQDASHDFVIEFTPTMDIGPQRVALSVELVNGAEESEVHTWGKVGLDYRGDASKLEFEGRESYSLEGVSSADRVWGDDLDADGVGDLVVSDVQADANGVPRSTLRVFKCGVDKCEPAGAVETAAASGAQIVATDMIVAPDLIEMTDTDEPQGFLAATVEARSTAGDITSVEVIWIQLVEDAGAHTVREQRATIDLSRAGGGGQLHEQTLEPRLLLDQESNTYRPGLVVTRSAVLAGEMRWSTLVLDADGVLADFREHRSFDGLDETQRLAALEGQLGSCMSGASKGMLPHEAPPGMLISAFDLDGVPSLAVSSIDQIGGPAQVFSLADHFDREQFGGAYGSVKCELGDLDGDGFDDLIVSLGGADTYARLGAASGQPASLLVAMGIDKADIPRGMAAPVAVIEGIGAESAGFLRAGERLSLHIADAAQASASSFSISMRSARTGRNAEVEITHDGEGVISLALVEVSLSPPGIPIHSFDRIDHPEAIAAIAGEDLVLRKRPGRAAIGNPSGERPLLGSTRLRVEGGSWIFARYGASIGAGDEGDALLMSTDPKTILGWSSTGPFLPVEPSNGQDEIFISELAALVYPPFFGTEDTDDQTTPLLYQGLRDEQGGLTGVTVHDVVLRDGRALLENERVITIDTSGLSLEGKKAVKFKAGAELSKSVNIAAPDGSGDCDDSDACPKPGEVLLAFELDSGEVVTAVHDVRADGTTQPQARMVGPSELHTALGLDASSDLSGLRTSLRIGHDGHEPVVILHGINRLGVALDEADESFVLIDRRGEVVTRESPRESTAQRLSLFGDVLGEGSDQLVVCKSADGSADGSAEGATHCRVERIHDPVDSVELEDTWSEAVSIGDVGADEEIIIVDVDGDRCADLVTGAGEAFSSRCDGSFEPTPVPLGDWAAHLFGANEAQDYNAARSNRPSTITWDDSDDDDDGALPFYDGLEKLLWE